MKSNSGRNVFSDLSTLKTICKHGVFMLLSGQNNTRYYFIRTENHILHASFVNGIFCFKYEKLELVNKIIAI